MTEPFEELDLEGQYSNSRKRAYQSDVDNWWNSQTSETKETKAPQPGTPEYWEWVKSQPGFKEEEGLIQPGKDPNATFIQNVIGTLADPVEWISLAGGGAWQAGRMGTSKLWGAIDWTGLGLPSLGKGIKGFGKGILEGLGAKAKEIAKPLKEGIAGATPELKIAAEGIKEGIQPTVAKLTEMGIPTEVSTVAEKMGSELNQKIEVTSGEIRRLAGEWDSIIEKARRGKITHEEAIAKGKELGMTIDTIKSLYPGTAMNAEQASALIDVVKPIADDSVKAAQKYLQTRKAEDLHEALYKFFALMEIDPKRFGVIAEAGRTLSQLNEPISGVNQYLNQFSKIMADFVPEGLTPEYLVHLIGHLETPEQLAIMARHGVKAGSVGSWSNALMEGWIMGLLSGPTTHVVNFTNNMLTTVLGIGERAIAARLAFGKGEHVVSGEASAMLYGVMHSLGDALQTGYKVLKTGQPASPLTKAEWYGQRAISAEALKLQGPIGTAVDYIGEVMRVPGRLLAAADDFSKTMNFGAEIRALALREGTKKGHSGETLANFVENFVKSPPMSAIEKSKTYAAYQTFTNELGKVGAAFQQFAGSHPLIKVMTPFIRTPINLTKYSFERTPLINALSSQLRSDIMAGGVKRDLALAKISSGMVIAGATLMLARSGYITGSGPRDKKIKDEWIQAGWKVDSVRVGDTLVSYARNDPFTQIVGAIADFNEVADDLDDPQIEQYAAGLVLGYIDHLSQKSYLYTLGGLYDMIRRGDISGSSVFRRMGQSIVPTLFRQIAKEIDPVQRDVNSVADSIRNAVPGWSTVLPSRIDLSGKERVNEGALGWSMISPYYKSKLKVDDPVWKEIANNRINISAIPRYISGRKPAMGILSEEDEMTGVELSPKEYEKLSRMAGNDYKIGGKGMWDTLTELVKSSSFKKLSDGPNGSKSDAIKKIVYNFRTATINKMIDENPELEKVIIEKKKARIQMKIP